MRLFAAITPPVEVLDHLENALAMLGPLPSPADRPRAGSPRPPPARCGSLTVDAPLHLAGGGAYRSTVMWVGVGGDTSLLESQLGEGALGRIRLRV